MHHIYIWLWLRKAKCRQTACLLTVLLILAGQKSLLGEQCRLLWGVSSRHWENELLPSSGLDSLISSSLCQCGERGPAGCGGADLTPTDGKSNVPAMPRCLDSGQSCFTCQSLPYLNVLFLLLHKILPDFTPQCPPSSTAWPRWLCCHWLFSSFLVTMEGLGLLPDTRHLGGAGTALGGRFLTPSVPWCPRLSLPLSSSLSLTLSLSERAPPWSSGLLLLTLF